MKRYCCLALLCVVFRCGIYTFNGSTLPAHLKTVDIPLFTNTSLQSGVAEELTAQLSQQVLSANLLRIVTAQGDATINGHVTGYSNEPRTYGSTGFRSVTISEYVVKIAVEIEFMDNKKNAPLYKGTITGEGVYDFSKGTEAQGRQTAEKDVVDQILQNSLQSW
jgi:Lipopolysaccharide-assembly